MCKYQSLSHFILFPPKLQSNDDYRVAHRMVDDKLMNCELHLTLSSANRLPSLKVLGSSSLHFWQIGFLLFLAKRKKEEITISCCTLV